MRCAGRLARLDWKSKQLSTVLLPGNEETAGRHINLWDIWPRRGNFSLFLAHLKKKIELKKQEAYSFRWIRPSLELSKADPIISQLDFDWFHRNEYA